MFIYAVVETYPEGGLTYLSFHRYRAKAMHHAEQLKDGMRYIRIKDIELED